MTRHSRFYRWLRKMFYRMVCEEGWLQAQATRCVPPERVTDTITPLVDLYDTRPMQRIVNASVPVTVPAEPAHRPAGSTTNVLRKYYVPQPGAAPGMYRRVYRELVATGKLPRSGRR
jgi:hypothetical protein